jgi:hypothetical protein
MTIRPGKHAKSTMFGVAKKISQFMGKTSHGNCFCLGPVDWAMGLTSSGCMVSSLAPRTEVSEVVLLRAQVKVSGPSC